MTDVHVAVIYYSSTGSVYALAEAAAKAAEAAGAQVRLRKVHELAPAEAIASNEQWAAHAAATQNVAEATLDDLDWADVLIFGTPTRFGLPSAQLKQFIDTAGSIWAKGKLNNKVATSFTSTGTAHGGQESTLLALNNVFYHWGAVIVPPGYADPIQFPDEIGRMTVDSIARYFGGDDVPPVQLIPTSLYRQADALKDESAAAAR